MPVQSNRGARSRDRILQVAVELCGQRGYAAVTMEAIASRAKVGKPTLYRWWPAKPQLMLDALLQEVSHPYFLIPDSGDLAVDLRAWINGFVDLFADPVLRSLCVGVVSGHAEEPDLQQQMIDKIHAPARQHNQNRIKAAQEAGQLASIDPDLVEDLLIAPLWYRVLISTMPITPEIAEQLLTAVLSIPHGRP